jgi:AraC family transcriptional regulator
MIRYTPLLDLPEFCFGCFDHPGEEHHHDPKLEVTSEYSVSRVEKGMFSLEIEGAFRELGPGHYFLNYPGMEYRCRHLEVVPSDVCVSINYLASANSPEQTDRFERVARKQPVHSPSNRLAYLFRQLAKSREEPMRAEDAVHEVIAEILGYSDHSRKPYRDQQLSWYAERVDAARQQMDRYYAHEQRLAWLARSVGMSEFHFARIFRELVGVPPHTYLRRRRLSEAARRLRDRLSVTDACFASGFQNLSHFTRQFCREFGINPSVYARQDKHQATDL